MAKSEYPSHLVVDLQDEEILGQGDTAGSALKDAVERLDADCKAPSDIDTGQLFLYTKDREVEVDTRVHLTIKGGILGASRPQKPRTRKRQTKKRGNGAKGKMAVCQNPDCLTTSGRKSRQYIAHKNPKYCCKECGNHYPNIVRRYVDICWQEQYALDGMKDAPLRVLRHRTKYRWLLEDKHLAYAKKLWPKVSAYWKSKRHRKAVAAEQKRQHEKGVTISRNTPTASV